jgi:hypothetical protein
MNSVYPQQKKNRDSFKDNIDSDEEKEQYENLNSQENHGNEEESLENSPFIMTIEIDKGISEKLHIFYDSIPEQVAYDFCQKHNLDYTALDYLVQEIKNLLTQMQTEQRKEHDPIIEEEEESGGSEGNNKKEVKVEDYNVSSNEIYTGENPSAVKISNYKLNSILGKEEHLNNELTNNNLNQSTNLNEANHTEMNFNTTGQITYDVHNTLMNTESTFKNSGNDMYKHNNSNSITNSSKFKGKTNIPKGNETYAIEQKLFAYQIFMDKHKTSKDNSYMNNPSKKSMKNSSTNITVFDKLYHDSKQRRHQQMHVSHNYQSQSNISSDHLSSILGNKFNKHVLNLLNNTNTTVNNKKRNNENVGEKLYKQGINSKKLFDCKIAIQMKQEMDKRKELHTHKPIKSKRTDNLGTTHTYTHSHTEEDVDILTRFECYKRNKDFEMRKLRELHEDKGNYSFKPVLTENTENIVRNKYLSMANEDESFKNKSIKVDKNIELHELARLKAIKMKNLELQHYGEMNFKPNINQSNKVYPDFSTRQKIYTQTKSEKQLK